MADAQEHQPAPILSGRLSSESRFHRSSMYKFLVTNSTACCYKLSTPTDLRFCRKAMTRVATEPTSTHRPQDTWCAAVASSWHRCHIGERSEYSVERLLAFRDYYQRTSTTRVFTVCILSPVPSLLTALLLDCLHFNPFSWLASQLRSLDSTTFAMTFASRWFTKCEGSLNQTSSQ